MQTELALGGYSRDVLGAAGVLCFLEVVALAVQA